MLSRFRRFALLLIVLASAAGCAPALQSPGACCAAPALLTNAVVTADGARLPLRAWLPDGRPEAVVLALHGFTDHSGAFAAPGDFWAGRGVAVYAYDQRGFGAAVKPGIWPGSDLLIADMHEMVALVRARHPGTPVFLLGESMGAAVVVAASAQAFPDVDGVILVAPAVWGWRALHPLAAGALQLLARLAPAIGVEAGGPGGIASDNEVVRSAMGRDPLVLHTVRLDAIAGLVTLMDQALADAPRLRGPALVLYGARDGIIPNHAKRMFLDRLDGGAEVRIYPDGYHMLLRDLQAEVVLRDVLAWMQHAGARLAAAD